LLGLQETGEDLLFLEGAGADVVSRDDREMIPPFIESFHTLRGLALSEDDTRMLIIRRIDVLGRTERE
jgi:hypothetical protein